tara:strand:- start:71 stop:274 length:204 start_codon:yes stop_codon:yes gene_type:complete
MNWKITTTQTMVNKMTELKRYPINESELEVILELKKFVETNLDRLAEEVIFWDEERIKLCQREEGCK